VHVELGLLDAAKGRAIVAAADEVLAGRWDGEFPLVVWQTGSGTQTNMNVNEVLANRASELMGGERGEKRLVHPNDDVNRGQSRTTPSPRRSTWPSPTLLRRLRDPSLAALRDTLRAKVQAFADVVKIGRTH
jgi:fumarate hydratase class II